MSEVRYVGIMTPAGPITVTLTDQAVTAVDWRPCEISADDPLGREVAQQLTAYFAGELTRFTLPLAPKASAFQQRFYDALCAIPFGQTLEYGDLAKALGAPAQAIGQACGGNPIPIIIPCHRVLAATGLGGFSAKGGVETKVMLLRLEGAASLLI